MNKLNAHLFLPLVRALADGYTLQINHGDLAPKWDRAEADNGEVKFSCEPQFYRVDPEELAARPPRGDTLVLEMRVDIRDLMGRVKGTTATFIEVLAERQRQDEQWGGPKHDDTHAPIDWLAYIENQTRAGARACGANMAPSGSAVEPDPVQYRERLVKIAALAIAALQSHDRKSPNGNYDSHELWQKGDEGIPSVILDANGDVALGLCKVCGRGESELTDLGPCPGSAD